MSTLDQLLQDLLDYQRSLQRSVHTIQSTRSAGKRFVAWLHNTHAVTTPQQLRTQHLHAYQKHLAEHITAKGLPLKPAAVNANVKAVRRLLQFLYDRAYTIRNHIHDLHYISEPQQLPTSVLTHKQVKKLLRQIDANTIHGIRDRAAIELLYSTGIRIGELKTLDIDHIDLANATIKVTGKRNKDRILPIGKTALRHLTSYIRGARPFLAQLDPQAAGRACFLNHHGRPLQPYALRQAIHDYAHKAKIDINVTPHTFRRSCTSEMIKANANLYHVKQLLGHESFTTLKHYTKLHIEDLRKTHSKCHPRENDET